MTEPVAWQRCESCHGVALLWIGGPPKVGEIVKASHLWTKAGAHVDPGQAIFCGTCGAPVRRFHSKDIMPLPVPIDGEVLSDR